MAILIKYEYKVPVGIKAAFRNLYRVKACKLRYFVLYNVHSNCIIALFVTISKYETLSHRFAGVVERGLIKLQCIEIA